MIHRWRAPNLTPQEIAALDQIDALREVEAIHGCYSHAQRTEWEAMLKREAAGTPQFPARAPRRKSRAK